MTGTTFLSQEQETATNSGTLRAAYLEEAGNFEFRDVLLRKPQTGEVCVKMEGCGLCASSIPVWEGRDWFSYPAEAGSPGHEGWGRVAAVGADVRNLKVGDRVALLSYHAFASHDFAPENRVVKLPEGLDQMPFPGEPLGCALNIFNRSDIQSGQTVVVIGCGFLGLLLVQMLKYVGVRTIALSRRASSLAYAKQFGADEIIPLEDHYAIIEQVKGLTDGHFCDRVIECTGKEWPLNLAGELCAERGRLIIAGFHQDGMRQVNIQQWNWKGLDVINAHERDPEKYMEGMREAIEAVERGYLKPMPLFTHVFPFEDINKAFRMQHEAPDGFVKAIIQFDN